MMSGTSDITSRESEAGLAADLREKQKHRNSLWRPVAAVAALAPVRWLTPAPGASSPESALGVGPRLLQNEPGDLDTQDSGGENEPTFMGRANPGPFSRRRSRSFSDRDLPGCIRQATRKIWRINSLGENSSVERNHSARAGTDPDYRRSLPAQASPTGASQRSVASRSTRLRRKSILPGQIRGG